MRLYDSLSSGNAYKVRLLLSLLGATYQRVAINTDQGESRTDAFLAINPNGRIPVLETDDGRHLAESNAILYFLAQESVYWPRSTWQQAQALSWMFFEQYSHEPYIAVSRYILTHLPRNHERRKELASLKPKGDSALAVMESHLLDHDFFVAESLSIADIALYAYTHVAPEGGFDLSPYPAIQRWIGRCQRVNGYLSIND